MSRHYSRAVYTKEVWDLCLHCRYKRCINEGIGCKEYRQTVKEVSDRTNMHKWGQKGKCR